MLAELPFIGQRDFRVEPALGRIAVVAGVGDGEIGVLRAYGGILERAIGDVG